MQPFIKKKKIVFGVSHSDIYRDCSGFKVVACGAGTMYRIGNPNSTTGHYNIILSALKHIDPETTCLVFEFGEVDLRMHITQQSRRKGYSPYQSCNNAIGRYFFFLDIERPYSKTL